MAKKWNKQKCIDFIVQKLDNEGITFNVCFEVILSKVKLSEPTFAKYWKEANEIHSEQREAIEEAKLRDRIEKEKEANTEAILTRIGNLEILTELASDKKQKASDRIKAIETINKMQGYNSAEKYDHTSKGETINKPTVIRFEDVRKLNDE